MARASFFGSVAASARTCRGGSFSRYRLSGPGAVMLDPAPAWSLLVAIVRYEYGPAKPSAAERPGQPARRSSQIHEAPELRWMSSRDG
jgi:hypothetical protein